MFECHVCVKASGLTVVFWKWNKYTAVSKVTEVHNGSLPTQWFWTLPLLRCFTRWQLLSCQDKISRLHQPVASNRTTTSAFLYKISPLSSPLLNLESLSFLLNSLNKQWHSEPISYTECSSLFIPKIIDIANLLPSERQFHPFLKECHSSAS